VPTRNIDCTTLTPAPNQAVTAGRVGWETLRNTASPRTIAPSKIRAARAPIQMSRPGIAARNDLNLLSGFFTESIFIVRRGCTHFDHRCSGCRDGTESPKSDVEKCDPKVLATLNPLGSQTILSPHMLPLGRSNLPLPRHPQRDARIAAFSNVAFPADRARFSRRHPAGLDVGREPQAFYLYIAGGHDLDEVFSIFHRETPKGKSHERPLSVVGRSPLFGLVLLPAVSVKSGPDRL
jgi:hypothetical protein